MKVLLGERKQFQPKNALEFFLSDTFNFTLTHLSRSTPAKGIVNGGRKVRGIGRTGLSARKTNNKKNTSKSHQKQGIISLFGGINSIFSMKIPSISDKKTWFSDMVFRGKNKPGNPLEYCYYCKVETVRAD